MADLYKSKPGTLVKSAITSPAFVSVSELNLRSGKMLATSFKLDRAQDVQHQRTLSADIYSYAFGEAMGRIQLGGVLFFGDCSGVSAEAVGQVNDFYSENNIYDKEGPLTVAIGSGNAFQCYLENFSVVTEASAFNIGSFNFGFSVIPRKKNKPW